MNFLDDNYVPTYNIRKMGSAEQPLFRELFLLFLPEASSKLIWDELKTSWAKWLVQDGRGRAEALFQVSHNLVSHLVIREQPRTTQRPLAQFLVQWWDDHLPLPYTVRTWDRWVGPLVEAGLEDLYGRQEMVLDLQAVRGSTFSQVGERTLDLRVRKLRRDDVSDMAQLLVASFKGSPDELIFHGPAGFDLQAEENNLQSIIDNEAGEDLTPLLTNSYKAVDVQGRLVGFVLLILRGQTPHLYTLVVHPEKQGRGVGRALLVASVGSLEGHERISLNVTKGNKPAIQLYQSVGFRPAPVNPHVLGRGRSPNDALPN